MDVYKPVTGGKPGQLGVGQTLGHQDGGQHDARDDVGPQPPPIVGPSGPEPRYPSGYPRGPSFTVPPIHL